MWFTKYTGTQLDDGLDDDRNDFLTEPTHVQEDVIRRYWRLESPMCAAPVMSGGQCGLVLGQDGRCWGRSQHAPTALGFADQEEQ